MQYVIKQNGLYIVSLSESLIIKRSDKKSDAKRFNEKDARTLASYLFNTTVELADVRSN